jgi:ferredoxin
MEETNQETVLMTTSLFHSERMQTRHIQLNPGLCHACWQCVDACQSNVLGRIDFLGHRHARIKNPDQCTGCLNCVQVCEHGALEAAPQPATQEVRTDSKKPKTFNRRAFVSVILFFSGLILPLSGIMNHELQFEPLTPQRHFWMSVHNVSALLFAIAAILHIKSNLGPLKNYLGIAKGMLVSREALAAVLLVAGAVTLFASHAFHVR